MRETTKTYASMVGTQLASTAASSFDVCGLLPVFSSWRITPTTMSSLMPSVSTLDTPRAPGEGGGVCSAPRGGFVVMSVLTRMFFVEGGLMAPGGGDAEVFEPPLDRFGGGPSTSVEADDGCLARFGMCTPSNDRETDFLLVS